MADSRRGRRSRFPTSSRPPSTRGYNFTVDWTNAANDDMTGTDPFQAGPGTHPDVHVSVGPEPRPRDRHAFPDADGLHGDVRADADRPTGGHIEPVRRLPWHLRHGVSARRRDLFAAFSAIGPSPTTRSGK